MAQATNNSETRRQILRAALKHFANGGYAATSVQQIVGDAKVSKPALYYHFRDKAALFEALVNEAHDGRFRAGQEAVARAKDLPGQLREALVALFDYFQKNHELTRIAFSTAYAAPGEIPAGDEPSRQVQTQSLDFIHALIKRAQSCGELDNRFDSWELAYRFYGQYNFYITAHLLMPGFRCEDRKAAERVVELFLVGAGVKRKGEENKFLQKDNSSIEHVNSTRQQNIIKKTGASLIYGAATTSLALFLFAGCGHKQQMAAPPPTAPEVGVVTIEAAPLPITTELPGRIDPEPHGGSAARASRAFCSSRFIAKSSGREGGRRAVSN